MRISWQAPLRSANERPRTVRVRRDAVAPQEAATRRSPAGARGKTDEAVRRRPDYGTDLALASGAAACMMGESILRPADRRWPLTFTTRADPGAHPLGGSDARPKEAESVTQE